MRTAVSDRRGQAPALLGRALGRGPARGRPGGAWVPVVWRVANRHMACRGEHAAAIGRDQGSGCIART